MVYLSAVSLPCSSAGCPVPGKMGALEQSVFEVISWPFALMKHYSTEHSLPASQHLQLAAAPLPQQ